MADDAAAAGRNGIESRIARGEERDAGAEDERDIRFELERTAEKCVISLVNAEQDGAPLAAFIDCSLNPRGVELLLVVVGE